MKGPKRIAVMRNAQISLLIALAISALQAGNWPQWRGPNADSVADGGTLPIEWSQTKNIRWSVKLPGWGTSSPVVYGDRVFVTSQVEEGAKKSLLTLCFDRDTGKELWRHDFGFGVDQRTHEKSNLAVNTPAVTEDAVYVAFGNADIARYSHDGKLIWVTRYMELFGDPKMAWGYGVSPLVLDDSVLFPWNHHKGPCFLIGLDKQTGEIVWQKERPIGTAMRRRSWSSITGRRTSSSPARTASPPSTPRRTHEDCGNTAKARGRTTARSSSARSTETAWCSCNCGGRARSTPSA